MAGGLLIARVDGDGERLDEALPQPPLLGHISLAYALLLVVGVVPGARLGAHLTLRASEERLRMLMGLFFTVLAMAYAASELLAI